MSFQLRSTDRVPVHESPADLDALKTEVTLGSLIAEDFSSKSLFESYGDSDGIGGDVTADEDSNVMDETDMTESHVNVQDEEGWITIPYKELPDNWNDAPDICSLHSLDRSFVFPGEQLCILACLQAYKQHTEIITPFQVAAAMTKNSKEQSSEQRNGYTECEAASSTREVSPDRKEHKCQNGEKLSTEQFNHHDVSASESLVRRESHKRQVEAMLQRFSNSHFFVRIAESGEQLWSKRISPHISSESSETDAEMSNDSRTWKSPRAMSCACSAIDQGNFDAIALGGIARDTVQVCSLPSGDIVVLLQVNIAVDSLKDPIIEILQFEKYEEKKLPSENQDNIVHSHQDPFDVLLKWLLPLKNTHPPVSRPLAPPLLSLNFAKGDASQKTNLSSSSGSGIFSFHHFRSHSMSSLPQNAAQVPQSVKKSGPRLSFEIEDWEQLTSQEKFKRSETKKHLSFRGVPLEKKQFSTLCGLEGIYIPGRRWSRKLEIAQPITIHSFAAHCNTDDLLCVQIKNICPAHIPDIVIYIDAITIVFEEASKVGPPSSLPIACIEAGEENSLPNLALRKGEEHSFILKAKPTAATWKNIECYGERSSQTLQIQATNALAGLHTVERESDALAGDRYAVIVSCRCNYTKSRLFFKQPTSWRPHARRDLMISVSSDIPGRSCELYAKVSGLPIQVLTIQATNLTSEDLTLTILAPESYSSPLVPLRPLVRSSEIQERLIEKRGARSVPSISKNQKQEGAMDEQTLPLSNVIPSNNVACTHLWLQSRVPLGCVPPQSTARIKLELLPLTGGIITLDTLQINVAEKGVAYIPECPLRIDATSTISTAII